MVCFIGLDNLRSYKIEIQQWRQKKKKKSIENINNYYIVLKLNFAPNLLLKVSSVRLVYWQKSYSQVDIRRLLY